MQLFYEIVLPVILIIVVGFAAAKLQVISGAGVQSLFDATFLIFTPALLFGAMARVDVAHLSPGAAFSYYLATVPLFAAALVAQRWRGRSVSTATVRSLGVVFSNTVMLGIPLVRMLYGETGLAFLLTIIAVHALIFLTAATLAIELDEAARNRGETGAATDAGSSRRELLSHLARVARAALLHPVVLPILAGLAWALLGLPLPVPIDKALATMGTASSPLCLMLLGASLAQFDLRRGLAAAAALTAFKSLLHPLLVWSVGRFVLQLDALPLAVATLTAALPIGANVYLFAQRYQAEVGVISAGVMMSTLFSGLSLPVVLILLR
ncbi:MAG: AEC family transporter [Burkholderiales bacterium]|nr:AEC family transporter [Burkholderiales bacterium]